MLERFTLATFAEHLGTWFRVHFDGVSPLEVELIQATQLRPPPRAGESGRGEAFSLVFRGAGDRLLPQKTFRVEHEKLGTLDLFLVPIGPDKEGLLYEAIFNYAVHR